MLAYWFELAAALTVATGQYVPAAILFGVAEGMWEVTGATRTFEARGLCERTVDALWNELNPATLDAARESGREMTLEAAVTAARRGLEGGPHAASDRSRTVSGG